MTSIEWIKTSPELTGYNLLSASLMQKSHYFTSTLAFWTKPENAATKFKATIQKQIQTTTTTVVILVYKFYIFPAVL